MAKHYVITNADGCIVRGFSDEFEFPEDGAICVCVNGGRHFELFGVVNPPLSVDEKSFLYKWDGNHISARLPREVEADKSAIILAPTLEERTAAIEAALLDMMLGGAI